MIYKNVFRLITLSLLLSLFVSGQPSIAQNPTAAVSQDLEILSWNIYMLPRFARITGKRQRARAISEELKNSPYHILVFQEAFLGDARRLIRRGLADEFPYEYGPANQKFSIRTNSGIWILSRLPLKELGEIAFSECAGFDDCMARKGALLCEGEWQGQTFQVLGTHLQAGGPDAVRHGQYSEIQQLLANNRRPEVPQIICGDMNTRREDRANYSHMIQTLGCEDGEFCGPQFFTSDGQENDIKNEPGDRKVIDFIFYRANGTNPQFLKRDIPLIRKRWSQKHTDLSDHFPVSLTIRW